MMKSSKLASVGFVLAALVCARVSGVEAGEATCPVEFEHRFAAFQDLTFTTGWQPPNSPVQLRLYAHLGGGIDASLAGDAILTWPEYYMLSYLGEESGGVFEIDIGVEVTADVRWDLPPPIGSGQAPLPESLIPKIDYLFFDSVEFDPFLLEGSPDAPVHAEAEIDKTRLYSYNLVDAITQGVPVPGFKAVAIISGAGAIEGDLSGKQIVTDILRDQELVHTAEGQTVLWPDDGNPRKEAEATYEAFATVFGEIILSLGINLEVAFAPVAVPDTDIPITILDQDAEWIFDPQTITFDVPPPEEEPDAGEDDTGEDTIDEVTDDILGTEEDAGNGANAAEDGTYGACNCSTPGKTAFTSPRLFSFLSLLLTD